MFIFLLRLILSLSFFLLCVFCPQKNLWAQTKVHSNSFLEDVNQNLIIDSAANPFGRNFFLSGGLEVYEQSIGSSLQTLRIGYFGELIGIDFSLGSTSTTYKSFQVKTPHEVVCSFDDPCDEIDKLRSSKDVWSGNKNELAILFMIRGFPEFSKRLIQKGRFSISKGSYRDEAYKENFDVSFLGVQAGLLYPFFNSKIFYFETNLGFFWGQASNKTSNMTNQSRLPLHYISYGLYLSYWL